MKRPWIVRELQRVAWMTGCVAVGSILLAMFAGFNGAPSWLTMLGVALVFWPITVLLYSLDYCCRCLEAIANDRQKIGK